MASAAGEPALGYHPHGVHDLTAAVTRRGTVAGGQFDWGGRLLKRNGGAPWFPQHGWTSCAACKGTRELDCKRDTARRVERRA